MNEVVLLFDAGPEVAEPPSVLPSTVALPLVAFCALLFVKSTVVLLSTVVVVVTTVLSLPPPTGSFEEESLPVVVLPLGAELTTDTVALVLLVFVAEPV